MQNKRGITMNATNKELVYTVTEEEYQEELAKGWDEDEILKPGNYTVRRARHITPRNEQKIKITAYIDGDILDFFKERAKLPDASPYQTQINQVLRQYMMNETNKANDEVVTVSMLENPAFLSALAEKLKAA
jgi:uncharacterized protein (DUF4415 family)